MYRDVEGVLIPITMLKDRVTTADKCRLVTFLQISVIARTYIFI